MRCSTSHSRTAAENLALDEALLLAAEEAERAARCFACGSSRRSAVVVGSGGSVSIDVNVAACEADGVPILRRAAAAEPSLLGPGCLCFSLVLRLRLSARAQRNPRVEPVRPRARRDAVAPRVGSRSRGRATSRWTA